MILDELIRALETCPDTELLSRVGVGDNYTILLKCDFTSFTDGLEQRGIARYNPRDTDNSGLRDLDQGDVKLFDYKSGLVTMQVMSWLVPFFAREDLKRSIEENGYNLSVMMVWNIPDTPRERTEGVSEMRVFAQAVGDIVNYVKEENLPAFFPRSKLNRVNPVIYLPE